MYDPRLEKVKNVAIYLRKSRDEENLGKEILIKHKTRLLEFIKPYNWNVVEIYEEIGSSDTIEYRPEFKRLLSDIDKGIYDAVVAVGLDRITRGSRKEFGYISEIFWDNEVLLVTPESIHDFSDEDVMAVFKHMFSRNQLNDITKKFSEGKKDRARLGYWSNSPAPYGYYYDRNEERLVVNEEEARVFRMIVDMYLAGHSTYKIATTLTEMGIPTRKGKRVWSEKVIKNMVSKQVYIGKIEYGKTQGSYHKKNKNKKRKQFKEIDREHWIISDGHHEPLMTVEEFQEIQKRLAAVNPYPKHSKKGKQPLSGLIWCGRCGKVMTGNVKYAAKKKRNVHIIKKCQNYLPDGTKCGNPGIHADKLLDYILMYLEQYENELKRKKKPKKDKTLQEKESQIELLKNLIEQKEEEYKNISFLYAKAKRERDKKMHEEMLDKISDELDNYERQLSKLREEILFHVPITHEERLQNFEEFKQNFDIKQLDNEIANKLLKTIIQKVYYLNENNEIKLRIIPR
jgi:site-specific DNA recombinase